jgi:SOS-response transcriptional repressor LexA
MAKETTEAVYRFIRSYMQAHQYPPSLREISQACYIGRSTVLRHLDKLEAARRIAREPGRARGISLIETPVDME